MPKKKNKKKEKEERERKEKELQEKLELERLEQEKLEEIMKKQKEKKMREEKEKSEREARDLFLKQTCDTFKHMEDNYLDLEIRKRREEEWNWWANCEKLPYPNDIPNMTTFLHFWCHTRPNELGPMMEQMSSLVNVLEFLDKYINKPLDLNEDEIRLMKEVREQYREEIKNQINEGTFTAIRNIKKYLQDIDSWECKFEFTKPRYHLWLWTWKKHPILSTFSRPAPSNSTKNVTFLFPLTFRKKPLFLKVWITEYDDRSDTSKTYYERAYPDQNNLYEETVKWYKRKLEIITKNYETLKKTKEVPIWFDTPNPEDFSGLDEDYEAEHEELDTETSLTEKEQDVQEPKDMDEVSDQTEVAELTMESKDEVHTPIIYDVDFKNIPAREDKQFLEHGTPSKYYREICNEELHNMRCIPTVDNEKLNTNINEMIDEESVSKVQLVSEGAFLNWEDNKLASESVLDVDIEEYILDRVFGLTEVKCINGEIIDNVPQSKMTGTLTLKELLDGVTPKKSLSGLEMDPKIKLSLAALLGRDIETDIRQEVRETITSGVRLSEKMKEIEIEEYKAYKEQLLTTVEADEINLRSFRIIGGVYNVELIEHVPQPFQTPAGDILQIHYGEYKVRKYNYYVDYKPIEELEILDDTSGEESKKRSAMLLSIRNTLGGLSLTHGFSLAGLGSEEEKINDTSDQESVTESENEEEDKRITITIELSKKYAWFGDPKPAVWNEENAYWTETGIYDIEYNNKPDEAREVTFKVTKIGTFGLYVYKYYHLPFQSWSLNRVQTTRSVLFKLTCTSSLSVSFLINGQKVCLSQIENGPRSAFSELFGVYYSSDVLLNILKSKGLDLFPDWDSFHYIKDVVSKTKVVEEHVYICMALLSLVCEFMGSKWNKEESCEVVIVQYRFESKTTPLPFFTVYCDMYRSFTIDSSEESKNYSKECTDPDNTYHPDLYNLIYHLSTEKVRKNIEKAHRKFEDTIFSVFKMLIHTKVLSFS